MSNPSEESKISKKATPVPNSTKESTLTTKDYDLFVSYCHEDSSKVKSILAALNHEGLVLFDPLVNQEEMWGRDLKTWFADVFPTRAKAAMIFLSKHYNQSRWCNRELEYVLRSAQENSSFLLVLPVRLDDAQVPPLATDVVFLDIAKTSPKEIASLTKSRIKALEDTNKSNLAILSDEELLKKIASERNKEAFEVLYKRIYPTILRYISSYFALLDQKPDDANSLEIACEVLVKLWEQASRFPVEESSFEKWLAYLTNRTIAEHELTEKIDENVKPSIRAEESIVSGLLTSNPTDAMEAAILLKEAMEGLPNIQKQILELYMSGMSFSEISETLDLSPPASRYIFYKLLSRLRNRIVHQEKAYSG